MLAHFLFQAGYKLTQDEIVHLAWLSNVALLIAGVGLVSRSALLVAMALVSAGMLHLLWLVDCVGWLLAGWMPVGAAEYLREADGWGWAATSYHLYMLPVLGAIAWRERVYHRWAMPAAMSLSLGLTLLSRWFLPEAANINFAQRVAVDFPGAGAGPGIALVDWVNGLPAAVYVAVICVGQWVLLMLPVA